MLLIIVSKCDSDKNQDRDNIHQYDTDSRECHKSDVKPSVKKGFQIFYESIDMHSLLFIKLELICPLDVADPKKDKNEYKEECDYGIEKDKERVITCDYRILHCYRIERCLSNRCTEGSELSKIRSRIEDTHYDEKRFDQCHQTANYKLLPCEVSGAHKDGRQFNAQVTFGDSPSEIAEVFADSFKEIRECLRGVRGMNFMFTCHV